MKVYLTSNGLKVAVVPRPALDSYNYIIPGYPETVQWNDKHFCSIKGICVQDFLDHEPDLVVYKLGDGSLLAASAEAIKASLVTEHTQWFQGAYETAVSKLQVLTDLPR